MKIIFALDIYALKAIIVNDDNLPSFGYYNDNYIYLNIENGAFLKINIHRASFVLTSHIDCEEFENIEFEDLIYVYEIMLSVTNANEKDVKSIREKVESILKLKNV